VRAMVLDQKRLVARRERGVGGASAPDGAKCAVMACRPALAAVGWPQA